MGGDRTDESPVGFSFGAGDDRTCTGARMGDDRSDVRSGVPAKTAQALSTNSLCLVTSGGVRVLRRL